MLKRTGSGILGSFVALICGWLAGIAVVVLAGMVSAIAHHKPIVINGLIYGAKMAGVIDPIFVIPAWLFVLLPLYLFVPSSHRFWRWPICTSVGALVGIVVLVALRTRSSSGILDTPWWYYPFDYAFAAISAGTTCLVGSIIHKRLRYAQASI